MANDDGFRAQVVATPKGRYRWRMEMGDRALVKPGVGHATRKGAQDDLDFWLAAVRSGDEDRVAAIQALADAERSGISGVALTVAVVVMAAMVVAALVVW